MRSLNNNELAYVSGGEAATVTDGTISNQCTLDAYKSTMTTSTVAGFIGGAVTTGPGALAGGAIGFLGGFAGQTGACLLDIADGEDSSDVPVNDK